MSLRTLIKPFAATTLATIAGYAVVGCAATPPPPELLDARSAYTRIETGPANQLKPESVHEAKVALEKAEKSFADDPGDQKTRDLSYLAARRAELAEVEARDAKAAQDKAKAEKELAALTTTQLSSTRQQLASASDRLASEKTAREAAEKHAKEAMDKLAAAANVKQDSRGTVITLPGGVLFASGKATLLPGAQDKLSTVADALKDQADHEIVVEGHTDSQGSDEANMKLSQARAQAVRDYLAAHGVPAGNIRAQGVGEGKPVADNATPEGRASNRRVEIVVSSGSSGSSMGGKGADSPYGVQSKPSSAGGSPNIK